jgi:DMSO/TMAO reductase YedYZ molybdopterin-dependent catalytic subunit
MGDLTLEELQLATRNHGLPLEALRYPVTPAGLHFLLIHYDIPALAAEDWRLHVGGVVERELTLSLSELRERPALRMPVTLECAGNGRARLSPRPVSQPWLQEAVGTAEWGGTPLRPILEEAGLKEGAAEVVFTGADRGLEGGVEQRYERSLPLGAALRDEVLLAYEMNGGPLAPQHGFPVRLLVPGWYGMASVKWLMSIEALTEPFRGFHQAVAYHYQQSEDDPGEPVTRIRPRALMIPPGFPDFPERRRYLDRGPVMVRGRAWSGRAPIVGVDVGIDGEWFAADLAEPVGAWAWRGWSLEWKAAPGDHVLSCRATDETGATQPLDPPWNFQGLGNNLVQEVRLSVR